MNILSTFRISISDDGTIGSVCFGSVLWHITEYFDIVAGVLQGDTLVPYLFIICLDYVLRTSIDKIRENGFELTKKKESEGTRKNNYRRLLRRWLCDTGKHAQPSQNTTA